MGKADGTLLWVKMTHSSRKEPLQAAYPFENTRVFKAFSPSFMARQLPYSMVL
jgi:hypothetical protein